MGKSWDMMCMNMYIWGRFGSTAYNEWTDDEKVVFETTTDGQTWTAVAEINKDNAPSYATYNEFVNRFLLFDIADETPIKFRVRWIPGTGQVRFYLKDFRLEMHIDTDEANAAAIPGSCIGEILD